MERRQIRKRWQITIPREIRQRLNLFEGQVINFEIIGEHGIFWEVVLFGGDLPQMSEMAAFKDLYGRKKRREKKAAIFGKSDMKAMKKALKILEKFKEEEP